MTDTVSLGDGRTMQIARLPEVDQATWSEMKSYLEKNPGIANGLQNFSKNPDAMRGWLQTQALAEYYQKRLDAGDQQVRDKMDALESNKELRYVFDDIKKNGLSATMKFWNDEALLLEISEKMDGLPEELQPALRKIAETTLSLQEAAASGNVKHISEYLKKSASVDAHDSKGVTALGHAIGSKHLNAIKLLISSRASPLSVDAKGNTGVHYAAGYGHREVLEHLLSLELPANEVNAQGQSPLALATLNNHKVCSEILRAKGCT